MYIGIVLAVALFVYLALKGTNIFLAAFICTLFVVVTNGMAPQDAFLQYFPFGKLGAFTFAGKFFLLFMAGSVFGRVTGESGAASSIAMAMINKLGAHRALWITVFATSLLTYGGVVVFVVIFAVYPLGLRLLQEANIPKRLFAGAIALGAGTYTLSALPGTPSIQNVIAAVSLDTDLFAGAVYGLFGGAIMFGLGMLYLERSRVKALGLGEGFEPNERDLQMIAGTSSDNLPSWQLSIIPLLTVIFTILLPRLAKQFDWAIANSDLVIFANSQPLLWPSFSLLVGVMLSIILFPTLRKGTLDILGRGAEESIMPLMATAVVIGFGGVVTQTEGFTAFTQWVTSIDVPPILSVFISVSFVSAIVGSATGGLQIFMETMSQSYISAGMDPEALHRIAAMASGGFDSLPHCGAVVAMLTITGLTHKQAYKDIGVITVVIPVIATLSTMVLYTVIS